MAEPAAAGCPTCGAAANGRFCAACGEQKISARDYSIAHYVGHVFESFTSFDFRSLRALWTLMARPGQLTRDYLDGRRRIYIGPVQLFVVVSIVFALAGANTFRRFLFEHLIFATHFLAFMLAWMLITVLLATWGFHLAGIRLSPQDWDSVASTLTLIGLAGCLFPALRRVFGGGRAAAVARTLGMIVLIYPSVLTYRFLLFFVTLWTMH